MLDSGRPSHRTGPRDGRSAQTLDCPSRRWRAAAVGRASRQRHGEYLGHKLSPRWSAFFIHRYQDQTRVLDHPESVARRARVTVMAMRGLIAVLLCAVGLAETRKAPLGLDLYLPVPEDNPLTVERIELG